MNKLWILITLSLYFNGQSFGQGTCMESQAEKYIENTEMKVMFRNGGDMFWDGVVNSRFNVPYTYGQPTYKTIYAAATWMGGFDNLGNLHVAAQEYRNEGNDYWAGPLDALTGVPVVGACTNFDRIWKVKRWAIEQHIADYIDNGTIDGPTDVSLLKWPGKGNPQFFQEMGFQLPNQELAPFFDRNSNGLYEPLLGDYPVFDDGISSAIAEEILWSVFNDNGNLHTQSNGQALKVEVQQTAYLFSCNNDSIMNRTLFLKHKVINRNTSYFTDYYYGHWEDPDLGCFSDDYVGTFANKNTIYTYNADANDDSPCGSGDLLGYGANPPVQAVTFLNQSLKHSIYHLGNGATEPTTSLGYYRLLTGYFGDGTPLTYGGSGYNPNDTNAVQTDFIFPHHPHNPVGWSMVTSSLSGLDQRVIGSVYKDTLHSGEAFTVDIAFSYHRDLDSGHTQNVTVMEQQLDIIQQHYDNNFVMPSCFRPTLCVSNCVYPGDANNNGIANDFDILEMGLNYASSAVSRTEIGDNWLPYTPPTPITNAYVDANGDSSIDSLDFDANTINHGETHLLYTGAQEGFDVLGSELFFSRYYEPNNLPWPSWTDTVVSLNGYLVVDVNFGSASQLINDLNGITFRVSYDNAVLDIQETPSSPIPFLGKSKIDEGWLDDDGAAVFARQIIDEDKGKVHYVASRLNQTNYTNGGIVGRLIFKTKITAPVNADTMSTQLCFEDFKAIRADGTTIAIGAQCETILYRDTNYVSIPVTKIADKAPTVLVYPNPAKDYLNVDLGSETAKSIQLFNVLGKLVYESNDVNGLVVINKNKLPQGMYTLVVQFENAKAYSQKVVFK